MRPSFQSVIVSILAFIPVCVLSQQPQFSVQALFGPTWYSMDDYDNSQSTLNFNFSTGGYLMVNIPAGSSTISFRSGYYYDTKNYVIDYDNTVSWYIKKTERKYSYGNVPLLFEVRFNNKNKFYPFISVGVIFGKLLSAEQITETVDGTITEGSFYNRSYNQKKQTDFHACTGANLRLNRLFLLRVEIFMGQQINQDGGHNMDRFGDFSYGIKTGIQFDLFLPPKMLESVRL